MLIPKIPYDDLDAIKKQLQQAKNRLKILENRKHNEQRRARTHRLIERGALLESLIDGAPTMSNEEIKARLQAALPPKKANLPGDGDSLA